MWVDKFECGRGTIRALDLVITLNELANVVIDTCLAKALSALVALAWVNHNVLAKTTVKQRVMLDRLIRRLLIKTLSSINLSRCKCHSSLHYQRVKICNKNYLLATCILSIFWHKLRLLLGVFMDGVAAIVRKT